MRLPFVRTLAGSVAPTPPTTDPNFENVTLLLHGDGTNGGQNNTFVDGSANNFAITRNGNTTQGTFSPYGNLWSNYFDGTGDFLSIPDNAAFDFGTGDFTIEAWVYIAGNSTADASGLRTATVIGAFQASGSPITTSYGFTINGSTTTTGTGLSFSLWQSGVNHVITATNTVTQHAWHHVAVARSGTVTKLFLDGSQVGSGTLGNQNVDTAFPITIGRIAYTGYLNELNGYISNLRVLKGTAQYTGSYTVPTAPLTAIANTSLLTCQSNRFLDASTNNFTITRNGDVSVQRFSPFSPTAAYSAGTIGGSGYFDGNDWLEIANNAAFNLSSSNFTVEAWVYVTVSGVIRQIISKNAGAYASGFEWNLNITAANKLLFDCTDSSTTYYQVTSTGSVSSHTWTHVAAVRNGSTITLYINGTADGTLTAPTIRTTTSAVTIGRDLETGGGRYLTGYISNARVVKGSAVYTANFTPPTAPLTAVTNTSLLLNFTNAAILDNAMMTVPETVGNAQIDTTIKKYGTGSLVFDGNGDYLSIKDSVDLNMTAGDFTIEAWVRASATSTQSQMILSKDGQVGVAYAQYVIAFNPSRKIDAAVGSGNGTSYTQAISSTTVLSLDVWYHVAFVKSGTTLTLYINGTSEASATQTGTMTTGNRPLLIGWQQGQPVQQYFNGYLDDLRITKGIARYTANFTPPTAALPDL